MNRGFRQILEAIRIKRKSISGDINRFQNPLLSRFGLRLTKWSLLRAESDLCRRRPDATGSTPHKFTYIRTPAGSFQKKRGNTFRHILFFSLCIDVTHFSHAVMQAQRANGLHHGYMQADLQTGSFRSGTMDLQIYHQQ